jgi:RNA polymerase sigma factor (sigma-70 family)
MEAAPLAAALAELHAASYGWALACCGRDASAAADVLQQAYWKVLEGKARFDERSLLKTWFFAVIRWTAAEQRRSVVRWLRRSPGAGGAGGTGAAGDEREAPASSSGKPDRATERSESAARLSRALAALAPRQREVLHLVFYEELSVADAATVMGVSVGSARQHYDRGKKRLKELLDDERRTESR